MIVKFSTVSFISKQIIGVDIWYLEMPKDFLMLLVFSQKHNNPLISDKANEILNII